MEVPAAAVTNRRTGTGGGIEALPEELLFDVLRRVGSVKGLFLFAVTCRRWLCSFADPSFLRGLCSSLGEGQRARLLGFFFRPTRFVRCERMMKLRMTEHTSVSAPMFRPMPGSPLGSAEDRALTSFIPDDDGAFNYAEPLAARRGIVLMQLVPRTFDLERTASTDPLLLALCNPITSECHVLPPAYFGRHYVYGYAIITAADGNLDGEMRPPAPAPFSQLLLITGLDGSDERHLSSYTAATRSWSAPTMCLDGRRFEQVGEWSAAIHRNAAHWLWVDSVAWKRAPGHDYNLYKLSAELGTARISLTKLPIRAGGKPHLCVTKDGKLSVACVYLHHVTVWTQQDGDGGDHSAPPVWIRAQVIQIPVPVLDPNKPMDIQEWREFNRGSMIVMYRGGGVFLLDLETKVMEKVMDCYPSPLTNRLRLSYVPYEMDLVEFFVSCLGGRRE